jgi:hypothetical protein
LITKSSALSLEAFTEVVFFFVVEQANKTIQKTIKENAIFMIQNNKYPPQR